MIQIPPVLRAVVLMTGITFLVSACADTTIEPPPPSQPGDPWSQRQRERFGTVWGEGDALTVLSFGRSRGEQSGDGSGGGGGGGIGVNAYIWQATLDTIDFIPLASADPFGGLIITDWYQPVDTPGERVKMHVQIRDAALRADAVRVSVFRQVRDETGDWLDAPVEETTARSIEDHILTRARELRIGSTAAS